MANEKLDLFFKLRNDLVNTEERAALLACAMVNGNGWQALHDAVEDMLEFSRDDTEAFEEMLDGGLEYLLSLQSKEGNQE